MCDGETGPAGPASGEESGRAADMRRRLGCRIRSLRVRKGLTQDALAERAGLSQKYLGEVERGIGNITVELLGRVADAFEVSQASLLEHDHERSLEELQADMARMIPRLELKEARIAYTMLRLLADG